MARIKNSSLTELIKELKKLSIEQDVKLWKHIATELEKPTRQRRQVNVYKIDKVSQDKETVIIAGKVLGMGELTHEVTVAALSFSAEAQEKIATKGTAMSIQELMKKNPQAKKIRILG